LVLSASRTRTLPRGCDLAPFAPHGVYKTADDRWLALSVQSDDEWASVVEALGTPESLANEAWADASTRFTQRQDIDVALQQLVGAGGLDGVLAPLVATGARAAAVLDGAALVEDPHLDDRGFFPAIDHADPELSGARLVGLGWRFAGDGPIPLRPPPALGSTRLAEEGDDLCPT